MNTLFSAGQTMVVKIGGSCFAEAADYQAVAQSLVARQKNTGARFLVPVSAARGVTDRLIVEARENFSGDLWAQARFIAKGEDESARLLLEQLRELRVAAQLITAADIGLLGLGGNNPFNGRLLGVNMVKLARLTKRADITVVPGYYAIDRIRHRTVLLGRNATDLIAVCLARALGAPSYFCKNGGSVYALDPNLVPGRFPKTIPFLSWGQADRFASSGHEFLMPKCLRLAQRGNIPLYLMPSPTAGNAWQVTAVIGAKPAEEGLVLGVRPRVCLNDIPCGCVTVTELGRPSLNGELTALADSVGPLAIFGQGSRTRIFLQREDIPALVGLLAEELNLFEPVA